MLRDKRICGVSRLISTILDLCENSLLSSSCPPFLTQIDVAMPAEGKSSLSKINNSKPEQWQRPPPERTPEVQHDRKPPLSTIINLYDFEDVAAQTIAKKTFAFYDSAATDLITKRRNKSTFDRILLRPRIMRDVRHVSTTSKILGHNVSLPLFISPAALAGLVHPDGEKAMARACVEEGIIQCISSNASFPVSDILATMPQSQPWFFQLYVNKDHKKTRTLLRQLLALRPRMAGIMITVDSAVPGKREADERMKADESMAAPNSGAQARNDSKGGGLGRVMGLYIDSGLHWEDLKWIREEVGPDMPLILKGIMGAADAKLAAEMGCQGIVVSNHGGRNLDTAPPSVLVLLEIQRRCPEVFDQMEVFVDGGIRRGTDILKCLALGATAVGLGRHFLYSLNYGQEGVRHLVGLLRDELETTMRLMGVTEISQIRRGLVNTADIDHLVPPFEQDDWAPKSRL